jgi:DNA-binding MarR family transcriptional regulator
MSPKHQHYPLAPSDWDVLRWMVREGAPEGEYGVDIIENVRTDTRPYPFAVSTLQKALMRLRDKGYLERSRDEDDRRRFIYALTPAARERVNQ